MRIFEIQQSINGEINRWHQGSPALFIRFAGCNLVKPCTFCDTMKAFKQDSGMSMAQDYLYHILNMEKRGQVVVLTGGEPLMQMESALQVLQDLNQLGFYKIVVETNGTINPKEVINTFPEVNIVMDYKLKSSGNMELMDISNFLSLRNTDFIKFPVQDPVDLINADICKTELLKKGVDSTMVVSPVVGSNPGQFTLPEWVLFLLGPTRSCGFTLSVQLHKLLNFY